MKKKFTVLAACAICAAGVVIGASAMGVIQKVESEIRPDFVVKIDGQTKSFKNAKGEDVYPMLYNGTTYLPVRAIGEIMGKTVYWYEDTKTVELKDKETTVTDADVIVSKQPDAAAPETSAPTVVPETSAPEKTADANEITLEQAKEIALQKAGLTASEVFFKEQKKDFDDGRWVYEMEFIKDGIEYSAEILVSDGTIVSWDIDKD